MTRLSGISILFLIFTLKIAAIAQPLPERSDRELRGYHGLVNNARTTEGTTSPHGSRAEGMLPTHIEEFDRKGNLVSETTFRDGKQVLTITFVRDSLGRVIERRESDGTKKNGERSFAFNYADNGVVADITESDGKTGSARGWTLRTYFRYDSVLRQTERREILPSGAVSSISSREYDRRGRLTREIRYAANGRLERKTLHQYDSLFAWTPVLGETTTYYSGDTLIDSTVVVEREANGELRSHTLYTSDAAHPALQERIGSHGRALTTTSRGQKGDWIVALSTRDEGGNIVSIEESHYDSYPSASLPPRSIESYQIQIQYDTQGNWIRKFWKHRSGNEEYTGLKIEQREIEYFQ